MKGPELGHDGVYDFDVLVHEPRLVRVGGEVVDVSVIPLAVSLALGKYVDRTRDEVVAAAEKDPEGELRRMLQILSDVCTQSNPKLTVDFLMEHLDDEKMLLFHNFIFARVPKDDDKGNAPATE